MIFGYDLCSPIPGAANQDEVQMACEDKMKITGWFERDLSGSPIDPNDMGPFIDDNVNRWKAFVRAKFSGLCADGCVEKFEEAVEPIVDDPLNVQKLTVRYVFTVTCEDPEEAEGGK